MAKGEYLYLFLFISRCFLAMEFTLSLSMVPGLFVA